MLKIITVTIVISSLIVCFGAEPMPWEPIEKTDDSGKALHKSFVEETKKHAKTIQIVFYGASNTEFWSQSGAKVWEQHYAPLHAVNYGIGGDQTQHIIWRMQNGEIEGLHPKVIVMDIGDNNIGHGHTDEEIAKGIKAIIDLIHTKLPQTKVIVLGIFPQGHHQLYTNIKRINSITPSYDDGKRVFFLNLALVYADSAGNIKPELFRDDGVHLTEAGYKVWAETMDPLLKHIMNIK